MRGENSKWELPSRPTAVQLGLGKMMPRAILASGSPARRQILEECLISVTVEPTDSDESHGDIPPRDIVLTLAQRKMEAYLSHNPTPQAPVITCDTLVHLGDEIFGKARDYDEAYEFLSKMQGRSHHVSTGLALHIPDPRYRAHGHLPPHSADPLPFFSGVDTVEVFFHSLDSRQIRDYLHTGEWQGAAGAYRIQGAGVHLIRGIAGDWSTIAGLPISLISDIIADTVTT